MDFKASILFEIRSYYCPMPNIEHIECRPKTSEKPLGNLEPFKNLSKTSEGFWKEIVLEDSSHFQNVTSNIYQKCRPKTRAGGRLAKAEGRRPDASAGRLLLAKSGQDRTGLTERSEVRYGKGVWGDGKGPPSNRGDFFATRCTLSTIHHML